MTNKEFQQKKAELTKVLTKQDAALFSFSSGSWESRETKRMGYYNFCAAYPYCRRCRNQYVDRYYSPFGYYNNRYPYYYYTTPAPFPFNLFGKK